MRGRRVLQFGLAALIGFSLVFIPILPHLFEDELVSPSNVTYDGEMRDFSLESIRNAVKLNEGEHAGESTIGNVSWHYLPFMVAIGLITGLGAYFVMRSRPERRV